MNENNKFYLTEIKNKKQRNNNKIIINNLLTKTNYNELVEKIKSQEYKKNLIEEKFLDFLIHKNTKFADFSQIEQHYLENSIKNMNQHNLNLIKIKKLKDLDSNLSSNINKILLNNLNVFENDFTIIKFNEEIEKYKKLIKLKEYELEVYNHVYSRTYKNNYLISKKINEQNQLISIYDEQYEKYIILKNNALFNIKNEMKKIKKIKEISKKTKSVYLSDLKKKNFSFYNLEFKVFMIKKNFQEYENDLNNYKNKSKILKNLLKNLDINLKEDYKKFYSKLKKFLNQKQILFKIFKFLNVKNYKNVIEKFNLIQKNHNNLINKFNNLNSSLIEKNSQLSELKNELKNLNFQINQNNNNFKYKLNDNIKIILKSIEKNKSINNNLQIKLQKKYELLENILNFILDYIQKIFESLHHPMILNFYKIDKKYINKFPNYLIRLNNLHLKIEVKEIKFNKNFLIFILTLLKDFKYYFDHILSNVEKLMFYSYNNKNLKNLNKNFNNNNNILFNTNSKEIRNYFIELMNNSFSNNFTIKLNFKENEIFQNEKKKVKSKSTNPQINSQFFKLKKNIKKFGNSHENQISRNNLLQKYSKYILNNSYSTTKLNFNFNNNLNEIYNDLIIHPKKHFNLIDKYTNEMVNDEFIKTKEKNQRLKMIHNKSLKIKNEKKDFLKILKKSNSTLENNLNIKNNSDFNIYNNYSEIIITNENENDSKKNENFSEINFFKNKPKKIFEIKLKNEEKNLLFKRKNDLRNLELFYFNKNNNKNNNKTYYENSINDLYFTYKKNFNDKFKNKFLSRNKKKNTFKNHSVLIIPNLNLSQRLKTLKTIYKESKSFNKKIKTNSKEKSTINNITTSAGCNNEAIIIKKCPTTQKIKVYNNNNNSNNNNNKENVSIKSTNTILLI